MSAEYFSLVTIAVYATNPEDALGYAKQIRRSVREGSKSFCAAEIRMNKENVSRVPNVKVKTC